MGKVGGDSFQLQKQWSLSEILCFRPSWLVSTFKRSSLNDFLFQKYLEVLPTPHSLIDWINILIGYDQNVLFSCFLSASVT